MKKLLLIIALLLASCTPVPYQYNPIPVYQPTIYNAHPYYAVPPYHPYYERGCP